MTVYLSYFAGAGWQFFDDIGNPLSGGKLETYVAGTTTPQATYTDNTGNIANSNPIILDSAGRPPQEVWLAQGVVYKFVVRDSANNLIRTYDNLASLNDFSEFANNTDPTKGDALIGFRQSNQSGNLVGAVGRTVHQKLQEEVSVKDFGATGDGVTDDTAAINAALAASNNVYFPPGNYKVTTINLNQGVGINSTGGNLIRGAGTTDAGTNIIGTAGYTTFQAWGDAPPAFTKSLSFTLKEMRLSGSGNTGIGIDLYSCINCRIENVYVQGYNYGLKARTTIGISFVGTTSFVGNNVGIKVPVYAAANVAATQNLCANLWTFDYMDVRSNVKCGASIGTAGQWTISNFLGESNDVAVYLLQDINYFVIDNCYIETARTPTVPNRKGVNQLWVVYMGRDEDGNTYSNISTNITLNNMMTWFDAAGFNFQNVNGLTLSPEAGRGLIQLGDNCRNVSGTNIGGDAAGNIIPVNTGQNMRYMNYRRQGYNYIINGNFNFDNLPTYYTNASAVDLSTQTLNSTTTRVLRVTCPIGQATTYIEFQIQIPYSIPQIMCLHGIAGDATFSNITLGYYDQSALLRSSTSQTTNLTSWHTLQQGYATVAGETIYYIRVNITRSNTTNVGYYYIDEIMSFNANSPVIQYPSVHDYMAGNVYTGTCTVSSGPLFYVEFIPTQVVVGEYYVIASNQQDAGSNNPTIFVEYQLNGRFRVYSNFVNTPVTCLVIPKIMQLTK